MENDKSLDAALKSAFLAGLDAGVGYDSREAIPGTDEDLFQEWRDEWHGHPWTVEQRMRRIYGIEPQSEPYVAPASQIRRKRRANIGETQQCDRYCDPQTGRHSHD